MNPDLTVYAVASQERVTANYIYRLLRLTSLSPDVVTAIVNGKSPPQLTAKKLMRLNSHQNRIWRHGLGHGATCHRPIPKRRCHQTHEEGYRTCRISTPVRGKHTRQYSADAGDAPVEQHQQNCRQPYQHASDC
jgi:hypothetical protein